MLVLSHTKRGFKAMHKAKCLRRHRFRFFTRSQEEVIGSTFACSHGMEVGVHIIIISPG